MNIKTARYAFVLKGNDGIVYTIRLSCYASLISKYFIMDNMKICFEYFRKQRKEKYQIK